MTARTLVNFEPLPPREGTLNRAQADADIRAAMEAVTKRLNDTAAKYRVGGYTWGDPEYDVIEHTVVGKLRLERPA